MRFFLRFAVAVLWLTALFSETCLCRELIAAESRDNIVPDTLETVSISAEKIPSVTLSPVHSQVLVKSAMEVRGISELYEAVKSFSGVQIRDYGGVGGIKTVSIRGLGVQHTGVEYDGVPVSNAQTGQIDIGRLYFGNLSQVQMVVGGSDEIFRSARSFSSAGMLILKTERPVLTVEKSAAGDVGMKCGTYDFGKAASYVWNPSLCWKQRLAEKWVMTLDADWMNTGGDYPFRLVNGENVTVERRNNADVNTLRSELNVYGDVGTKGVLTVKGNFMASDRGLPGQVVLYNTDSHERLTDRNGFGQVRYEHRFGRKWRMFSALKYFGSYMRYHDEKESYQGGEINDEYWQNEYYLLAGGLWSPMNGLSFSLSEDLFVNTLKETIPDSVEPVRLTNMTSVAARYSCRRVTATASALLNYQTEWLKAGSGEPAPDRCRLSPAANVSVRLLERYDFRLRASYQNVFRTPTFNDLYYSRVGSRDLKPETANQFNLGLTWVQTFDRSVLEDFSVTVDGYYNAVKDKIVARPTMFIWQMRNLGSVNILGADIDISASLRFTPVLSLSVSGTYSYQYAVDVTDRESKSYGNQIPYTPRHSGGAAISFLNPWVNVSYSMTGVSERFALDQNTEANRLAPYTEHNLTLSHIFALRKVAFDLKLECRNFTDAMYEVIQFYPMPGRSYWITFGVKL